MEALSTGTRDNVASGYDIYVKDLSGGRMAAAVFNRSSSAQSVPALNLADLYMDGDAAYTVKNVWEGSTEVVSGTLKAGSLKAYQTKVFVFTRQGSETGITETENGNVKTENCYDLSGRRVQNMQTGVSITDGKVVVKK